MSMTLKGIFLCILFAISSQLFARHEHFSTPPRFNILMIYSGNRSNEACLRVANGVQAALLNRAVAYSLEAFEINILYDHDPKTWDFMMDTYMMDIKRHRYNLIVAEGNEGASTLLKRLAEVPEQTSVIFSNISHFDLDSARKRHFNTTAVLRPYDPLPNIRFGMKLYPNTRKILLLTSSFDWKEEYRAKLLEALPKTTRLEVVFFDNDSPETLKNISLKLKTAGTGSFIVSMDWDRFFANRELRVKTWSWLKNNYSGPILIRRQNNLTFGLCGMLQSLFSVGAMTGEFAEKVALGTMAGNIRPGICPTNIMCNMEEAERLNIDPKKFPSDTEFTNTRPAWISRKGNGIIVISGVFLAIIMALVYIIVVLFRKKRQLRNIIAVFNALPVRVMVFDRFGNILFLHVESVINPAILPNSEYRNVSDLPDIGMQKTLDAITMAMNSETPIVADYNFGGEHSSVAFRRLDDRVFGKPTVLGISFDTDRLQKKYLDAQKMVKCAVLAFDAITDAIVVTDTEGLVTMLNAAAKKRFNCLGENILEKPAEMLCQFGDSNGKKAISAFEKVLNGGRSSAMEFTSARPNGVVCHEMLNIKSLNDAKGLLGTVISLKDISTVRQVQESNEIAIKLMEFAMSYAKISFFRMDLETGFTRPVIGENLRFFPVVDGKSLHLKEWMLPEDLARFSDLMKKLRDDVITQIDFIFQSDYSGMKKYLNIHATILKAEFGNKTSREIIGILRDDTQRIQEEKLAEEKKFLQKKVENAMPYPVFLKDPDDHFRYIHCNQSFADEFGLMPENIIGKTDYELFERGSEADLLRNHDREAVKTGKPLDCREEYHDITGHHKTIAVRKLCIGGNGSRRFLLGVAIDISEVATNKAETDKAIGFYTTLLDQIPANIYVKDADNEFRYVIWNRMLEEQTGFSQKKILGNNNLEQGMPKAKAALYESEDIALMKSGKSRYFRKNFIHKTKGEIVCDVYQTPVTYESHHYLLGMSLDVTEQLKALNTLKKADCNAELFSAAMKTFMENSDYRSATKIVLEMFVHAWNADLGFVFRKEGGYFVKESEFANDGGQLLDRYADTEMPSIQKVSQKQKTLVVEDIVKMPEELRDSKEMLLAQRVKSFLFVPLFQHDCLYGQIGFIWRKEKHAISESDECCIRDVGELFLIAREHEHQRDMLNEQTILREKIFSNVRIPLSLLDAHCNLLFANHMFCDLFKIPRTGVFGKNCQELCPKNHSDYCTPERCPILSAIKCTKEATITFPLDARTIQANAFPILNEDGQIQYVLQTHIDVTKISREKQELKEFLDQNKMIGRCTKILLLEPDLKKAFDIMAKTLEEYYAGFAIRIMRSVMLDEEPRVEPFAIAVQPNQRKNIQEHSQFPEKEFPIIFRELRAGNILSSRLGKNADTNQPQWYAEITARQKQLGFSDVMLFPLFCKGNYWGYMDVDRGSSGESFTPLDMRVFKEAKHVLETVLEREAQIDERLREKAMNEQLFDRISIPMYLVDREQKIRAANRALCDLFHMSGEAIIGNSCLNGICSTRNAEECKNIDCPVRYTLKTGKAKDLDYFHNERLFHWKTQPIFGLDGKVEYVLGSAHDVTDERASQKKLAEQTAKLQKLNSEQKRYLEQDRLVVECLEIVIFEKNMNTAWEKILSWIGVMLQTEGVALMQFKETSPAHSLVRNIWLRDASQLNRYNMRQYPAEAFAASNELLRQGKTLHGWKPELHSDIPWEKEFIGYCELDGQNELAAFPIRLGNHYWGHLAVMQSLTPPLTEAQMRLLGQLAHIIEILISREIYLRSDDSEDFQKHLIINSVGFPLVLFNEKIQIININDFARKLNHVTSDWKKNPDGCAYCRFREKCDPHNPREECILHKAITTQLPQSAGTSVGDSYYNYTAVPILKDGKVSRVLLSGIDITNVVQQDQHTRDELHSSQRKLALWRSFSFLLAQDVQRQMEALSGALRNSATQQMSGMSTCAPEILDTVLNMSKMETENQNGKSISTDISSFLEKIRQKYLAEFQKRALVFDLNIASEIPALRMNSLLWEKILSFFVEKALLYTVKGGVQISAEYALMNRRLTLSIRDTGIGMEPEILAALQNSELPSPEKLQDKVNPIRIQILMYAELIRSCGGMVQINSQKGRGSCFILTIPALPEPSKSVLNASAAGSEPANPMMTVLVVDDVMMNLKVISMMLKKMGYTAIQASSGQAALEILNEMTPLCVLTDIWMPEMNGVELAANIRKKSDFDSIPLFAVTADAESERSFDMSVFQSILIKPVTIEKLKQVIDTISKQRNGK